MAGILTRRAGGGLATAVTTPAEGSAIFNKRLALQRALNLSDLPLMDIVANGDKAEEVQSRLKDAVRLSEEALCQVFGKAEDRSLVLDCVPGAYTISKEADTRQQALTKLVHYLRLANDSAEGIWPEGAIKRTFPFRPQYSFTPTMMSSMFEIQACADIYDLRLGRQMFVRALSSMVMQVSVNLAQSMLPNATKPELSALTQSLVRRVTSVVVAGWKEASEKMIATLKLLPEDQRPHAAQAMQPVQNIRSYVDARMSAMPDQLAELNAVLDQELDAAMQPDPAASSMKLGC